MVLPISWGLMCQDLKVIGIHWIYSPCRSHLLWPPPYNRTENDHEEVALEVNGELRLEWPSLLGTLNRTIDESVWKSEGFEKITLFSKNNINDKHRSPNFLAFATCLG